MDTKTTYLGLELKNPLVVGASPIVDDIDNAKRAADAGAAAFVMHSLFEEQLLLENATVEKAMSLGVSAEASTYMPEPSEFVLGPDKYLEQIRKVKEAVGVPVIGSLNGVTDGGWLEYAKLIEQAGADALELNLYSVAHDPKLTAVEIEQKTVAIVKHVVQSTSLPVAVKLSPYYTSVANLAYQLEGAGAKGLVLFNRFYQPDIDIDNLEVELNLNLSHSNELLLRLRWLALLSGRVSVSLAASGGVHTGADALKAIMAGANAVQVVSALLIHGPQHLRRLLTDLTNWLTEHGYESVRQAQGSMNLIKSPQPEMYERGNYVKILQGYTRSWR